MWPPPATTLSKCSRKLPVPSPTRLFNTGARTSWTPSPARNTWTVCPASIAAAATKKAKAALVGFSGPQVMWTRRLGIRASRKGQTRREAHALQRYDDRAHAHDRCLSQMCAHQAPLDCHNKSLIAHEQSAFGK